MPYAFLHSTRRRPRRGYCRGLTFFALKFARHVASYSSKHQNQSQRNINNTVTEGDFIPERGGVLFSVFYINGLTRRCRGYLYNYWSNNEQPSLATAGYRGSAGNQCVSVNAGNRYHKTNVTPKGMSCREFVDLNPQRRWRQSLSALNEDEDFKGGDYVDFRN